MSINPFTSSPPTLPPVLLFKGSIYYLGRKEKITAEKQKEFFDIIAGEVAELADSVEHLLNFLRRENETRIRKIRDKGSHQSGHWIWPR
jgi:hypothetical protein